MTDAPFFNATFTAVITSFVFPPCEQAKTKAFSFKNLDGATDISLAVIQCACIVPDSEFKK